MEVARRTFRRKSRAPQQQLVVYGGPAQVGGLLQMRFNFEDLDAAEALALDLLEEIAAWREEIRERTGRVT